MGAKGPVFGTADSSFCRPASLPKSTTALKWLTSPEASALAWDFSFHHVPSAASPTPPSAIVLATPGELITGLGSSNRKAGLNRAAPEAAAPPGALAPAVGAGVMYLFALVSHSPTPAAMRTALVPGSQAAWGTRTSNWRRRTSTPAMGAGDLRALVAASRSSAVVPCTVRNSWAGELTPAPFGHGSGVADEPSAIVKAVRAGSLSVLRVTRNSVASPCGFTRSSTRSAPLFAKAESVG